MARRFLCMRVPMQICYDIRSQIPQQMLFFRPVICLAQKFLCLGTQFCGRNTIYSASMHKYNVNSLHFDGKTHIFCPSQLSEFQWSRGNFQLEKTVPNVFRIQSHATHELQRQAIVLTPSKSE